MPLLSILYPVNVPPFFVCDFNLHDIVSLVRQPAAEVSLPDLQHLDLLRVLAQPLIKLGSHHVHFLVDASDPVVDIVNLLAQAVDLHEHRVEPFHLRQLLVNVLHERP